MLKSLADQGENQPERSGDETSYDAENDQEANAGNEECNALDASGPEAERGDRESGYLHDRAADEGRDRIPLFAATQAERRSDRFWNSARFGSKSLSGFPGT